MIKKHYDTYPDLPSGGGMEELPIFIQNRIIAAIYNRYGDVTVYSHGQAACFKSGAEWMYGQLQAELAALKKENERLRKGLGEVKSYIEDSDVPVWSISSIESIIEAALK